MVQLGNCRRKCKYHCSLILHAVQTLTFPELVFTDLLPIKLLIISPWYPNRVHPQDGNFVRRFAELAADWGEVKVIYCGEDTSLPRGFFESKRRMEGKLEVIRVYYSGAGARVQRRWWRSKAWRKAIQALGAWRPTLLHAHVLIDGGILAACLGAWWKTPFVISAHSSRYLEASQPARYALDRCLAKWSAARASAVLPVSPTLQRALKDQGFSANFRVVPNLVEDQLFLPPSTERDPDQPYTLFHLSDFSRQKNLPLLLESFSQLALQHPNLQLIIAGNGSIESLQTWKRHHPAFAERVHFLGTLTQEEVVFQLQVADLFVLSSTVETQAIVLMEALLCGLAVVATRCGGPEDLIAHQSDGTLVTDHTPSAFSAAINSWLSRGPEELADRSARAENARKRFNKSKIRVQLLKLYQEAMAASGGNPPTN